MNTKYKKTKTARKPNPEALLKRQELVAKSETARTLMEMGAGIDPASKYLGCERVNEFLMFWHKEATGIQSAEEWHTFKGWKELGFSVKKGSSGFAIWGQPRKFKGKTETEKPDGTIEEGEKKYKAFPMCYLFNSSQVQDSQGNDFQNDNVFQRLAMIPFKVKNAPLAIPMAS